MNDAVIFAVVGIQSFTVAWALSPKDNLATETELREQQ